jgi:hypothetical protein
LKGKIEVSENPTLRAVRLINFIDEAKGRQRHNPPFHA